ncbi:hypothetical protein CS542_03170 [Pedobacter sp. IW39]|nr:hypothetical protein CS542_03170 [Pedobacter sp. IW39]
MKIRTRILILSADLRRPETAYPNQTRRGYQSKADEVLKAGHGYDIRPIALQNNNAPSAGGNRLMTK